jgi:hypothetical protein
MSKLLANRAKLVLRKLIHSDQKGFVEGGILVKVTECDNRSVQNCETLHLQPPKKSFSIASQYS